MCERGLIQEMPDINKDKTCCFFGHRKIEETPELKTALVDVIEDLIINKDIDKEVISKIEEKKILQMNKI